MRARYVIAAFLISLLSAPAFAQSWEEFRPQKIGFRVEMPGTPKIEQVKTQGGNVNNRALVTIGNDKVFLVVYSERADIKSNQESVLDAIEKSQTADKKIISSKKEILAGFTARRLRVEDKDKDNMEIRFVIANGRLIQVLYLGPAGDAQGRRFLDSFAVVEP